jgi:hypothetical protein
VDVDHALQYLDFVQERHRIWERRQGIRVTAFVDGGWTSDPVLRARKFTNVFRVLDPGSQFVVEHLLDGPPEDVLLRVFLYRHTGSLPAWWYLHSQMNEWPHRGNLSYVWDCWQDYRATGGKVFMRAYNVNPFSIQPGTDKLQNILRFMDAHMVHGALPKEFLQADTWRGKYEVLHSYSGVGKFMAMQVLTDYGYSTEHRENEWVVAGPGSQRGAAYVWPRRKAEDTIRWAQAAIQNLPNPPEIWGCTPSLMDVQNAFCEYSKYVRWQGKPYAGPPYQPLHPGPQPAPLKPRHW